LDDDIAVQLASLRDERKMRLRDAVNVAMRLGLTQMLAPVPTRRVRRSTPVFHAERSMICEVASTAEMLAVAEGEAFRCTA
jgi:hypothetical protein